MPKRWYDSEATMSLAVSMLKNATSDMQDSVCNLMEQKFTEMNIQRNEKFIMFKVFDKRWYDEKENIYNLLETIRLCSAVDKRKCAACIIDHLCKINE